MAARPRLSHAPRGRRAPDPDGRRPARASDRPAACGRRSHSGRAVPAQRRTRDPPERPHVQSTAPARAAPFSIEAFLLSAAAVALAEIGDKTQLLALILAVRHRQPWPIVAGIVVATLANHTLAAALGGWIRNVFDPVLLRWLLAASFLGVAAWTLVPDRLADESAPPVASALGVFGVTVVAFFLAEMGDKTQVATAVLAARFDSLVTVVAGTTVGMLVADVPAVFAGHLAAVRIPLRAVRIVAALLFAGMGIALLVAD